ncbi:MAG: cob(I)yrinic acid a,c-diamide adenosyltransferase [Bacteroidales bacterium]|nr:cob(I)yrinic acid a,c-diamide adenosyltransferase [Bacteroidales bacterium]
MIYTKKGDDGTTSLADGTRVSKASQRVEAYGTVDELGAHIALLIEMSRPLMPEQVRFLQRVQNELFVVQSRLATADLQVMKQMPQLATGAVENIEHQIDLLTSQLPPMKAFVIPGGTVASAQCHVCRTVCRRAERNIVALSASCDEEQKKDIFSMQQYINRLSDFLFVMARRLVLVEQKEEIFWHPE